MSKAKTLFEQVDGSGIPKSEIYEAWEKFKTEDAVSRSVRTVYVGYCSKLLTNMAKNGATEDEMKKAIMFSIVVLDSLKKQLSIEAAKRYYDISFLNNKYS